jgi:hypothetical protein
MNPKKAIKKARKTYDPKAINRAKHEAKETLKKKKRKWDDD